MMVSPWCPGCGVSLSVCLSVCRSVFQDRQAQEAPYFSWIMPSFHMELYWMRPENGQSGTCPAWRDGGAQGCISGAPSGHELCLCIASQGQNVLAAASASCLGCPVRGAVSKLAVQLPWNEPISLHPPPTAAQIRATVIRRAQARNQDHASLSASHFPRPLSIGHLNSLYVLSISSLSILTIDGVTYLGSLVKPKRLTNMTWSPSFV